jgi:hypothetical protein
MTTPNRDQINEARRQLRSCIFNLVQRKYMTDAVGLHLLRVVEMTMRTGDQPAALGSPASLYIEDEQTPDTWRAYPSGTTTIEELKRACEAFNVRPWVDLDGRVCLVMADAYGADDVPPDACALVGAMYGTDPERDRLAGIMDELPAFLKRQAD